MKGIPIIGGARGLFEIFVPGVFLLLNVGIAYDLLSTKTEMGKIIKTAVSDPVSSVVVTICFGYLTGLLLRLFSTDRPDEWSAKLHRILGSKEGTPEKFPYIGRIGERCKKYLPLDVQEFYSQFWKDRKQKDDHENKMFFNFCKTVINSADERAASEIYAAEAFSRYIAGMFYALILSCISLCVAGGLRFFFTDRNVTWELGAILIAYIGAIVVIVYCFRHMRYKEVEIVFAASFRNKSKF